MIFVPLVDGGKVFDEPCCCDDTVLIAELDDEPNRSEKLKNIKKIYFSNLLSLFH